MADRRRPTSTSAFGVGRRESHDATAFYERFPPPVLSDDSDRPVYAAGFDEPRCIVGDSRKMVDVPDASVALVVTSPPYFAGKEYEQELGVGGVPASYADYLDMLTEVFSECVRVLEPGGRIAVNVANLGRKPYRSLSADVIGILQELGLLLRGEVIWQKAEGAANSLAWGSFRSPTNPVIRDLTERVVIASKGRFDRALPVEKRIAAGLPHETDASALTADEYMEATLDVWHIPAESARRVKHPAPFPVALPARLINLYTYRNDLVLDPFMGSGSTLVAAVEGGRRTVGYDLDETYCEIARQRVEEAMHRTEAVAAAAEPVPVPAVDTADMAAPPPADAQARATFEGQQAKRLAESVLDVAGFEVVKRDHRLRHLGVEINLVVESRSDGRLWFVDVSGAFTVTSRGGLRRTDTLWKTLGRAALFRQDAERPDSEVPAEHRDDPDRRLVRLLLLTSHLPEKGHGLKAMHAAGPRMFWDAIEMRSDAHVGRLAAYASGGHDVPLPGFWVEADLRGLR